MALVTLWRKNCNALCLNRASVCRMYCIADSFDQENPFLAQDFCTLRRWVYCKWGSQVALVIKNLPASSGDIRDMGSIPRSGRSPGGGATHSSILAWKIPWTEQPGRLQFTGLQRVRHAWATSLSLFHCTKWMCQNLLNQFISMSI